MTLPPSPGHILIIYAALRYAAYGAYARDARRYA